MAHLKRAIKQAIILINDNIAGTTDADNDIHLYEDNYKRQLSMLSQAIEDLPNRQKQAFKLRKLEGRNHREIATALNISESTAKDYVKSAVISLKKSIQGQNPPPELILALLTVVNMCS
jgi:RNA polymerase sigma-70 factor (ECF subfamily)